jgi:hypothetical protein
MRRVFGIAALFTFLAASVAAHAADASGTWKGSLDVQGSTVPLTLHLSTANGALTGTVEGLPTTPAEIHDGKADGSTITFWVNTDYQGQTYKLDFVGKLSPVGDEIAFNLGTEDGNWSAQMTVERGADAGSASAPAPSSAPTDLTGTWKGSFDYNGNSTTLTIHLTNAAGVLTGAVEGLPTTPAEIHDGKVTGDTVTFWANTDYQGQTYKLVYSGKIASGQIVFTLGTEDGSWSTQLTATKAM